MPMMVLFAPSRSLARIDNDDALKVLKTVLGRFFCGVLLQ